MINRTLTFAALGAFAVVSASAALAQSSAPETSPAQDGKTSQSGGMMGGKGEGMKMDDAMKKKMSTMMDNCNEMMESKMKDKPAEQPAGKQG